jgi:hypothetical protein
MNCENCKYFKTGSDDDGICRKHPPVLIDSIRAINGDTEEGWGQPWVLAANWCGEWKEITPKTWDAS